jgi:hypothetical protein
MDDGCVIREYRQSNVLARLEQPLAVPITNTQTAGFLLAQKDTPTKTNNQITLHPPPNVNETRCPQIALEKDTFPSLTYDEYKALGLPRPNPAIKVNGVFWETISNDMYTLELFRKHSVLLETIHTLPAKENVTVTTAKGNAKTVEKEKLKEVSKHTLFQVGNCLLLLLQKIEKHSARS